jgi:hypothetical protein
MGSKPQLDEVQQAKVVRLFTKHGLSTVTLSERFGVGSNVISAIIRKAGIDPRQNDGAQ